ncbi:hypothetical protein ISCGN_005588 [Ixodes scapularis]
MFVKRSGKLCNSPSCRNRLTRAGEFRRNQQRSQGYGMGGANIELNAIYMAPFCLFSLLRASVAHDVSNVASRRSAVSTGLAYAPAQRASWEQTNRPPWSRRYRRLPRHNHRRRLTVCDYCLSEFRPHYGHHVRRVADLCRSCADVVECRRHQNVAKGAVQTTLAPAARPPAPIPPVVGPRIT